MTGGTWSAIITTGVFLAVLVPFERKSGATLNGYQVGWWQGERRGAFTVTDSLLSYLACQLRGVATVPINTRLAPAEVGYILKDSDATVLMSGGDQGECARSIAAEYDRRLMDCDAVADGAATDFRRTPLKGSDVSVVFYTSGTTGFPKGAAIAMDCWSERLMWWGWEFDVASHDVMLVPGPTFHMSFCSLCLCALYRGARLRIVERFDVAGSYDELRDTCTWSFLVPTMSTMMLELWRERGREPLKSPRIILSSGAALSPSTLEDMMAMFPNARIFEAYGWTEAGWVTSEVKRHGTIVPHSVGWSAFGSEVVVLDENGEPCATGLVGEVAACTPVPFSHYLNNPEATGKAWAGKYQKSGDIGMFLEDGRLKLLDRRNDMIVTGGENVYPAEIEGALVEHPAISDAAVFGIPHHEMGEEVRAAVVLAPGVDWSDDIEADVVAHCRERLAGYKLPRSFEVHDELPRSAAGKLTKRTLRDPWWADRDRAI